MGRRSCFPDAHVERLSGMFCTAVFRVRNFSAFSIVLSSRASARAGVLLYEKNEKMKKTRFRSMFLTEMIKFIFVHFLSAFPLTVFDCVDNIQVSDRTDRRLHKSSRQALCHFFLANISCGMIVLSSRYSR